LSSLIDGWEEAGYKGEDPSTASKKEQNRRDTKTSAASRALAKRYSSLVRPSKALEQSFRQRRRDTLEEENAMQGSSHTGTAPSDGPDNLQAWGADAAMSPSDLFMRAALSREARAAYLARTLEHEIIPRLVEAHRANAADACNDALSGSIAQADVERFTESLVRGDEPALMAALSAWRDRGLSVEQLLVDLLAPSARHLGHMWCEDLCYFTDVTIGLGRLQRMMRELSPAFGTEVAHPPNGRRALLVRAPGEQHSFGLSMVAEFFRRAGWEVVSAGEGEDTDPVTAVRREWFDVVGFSAGSEARLEWLPACIAAVRRASCHREVAVLVGGPVFTLRPHLARQFGADAAACDGSEAPGLAESLLAGRVKRS
jgi:methanogenic corrinoid protein MtbC1